MSAPRNAIGYKAGTFSLVPKKYTVGQRIAVRGYEERNKTELSDRTYKPQKHWFSVSPPPKWSRPYEEEKHLFYNLETKLIWRCFDTPELVGMLLHDETIHGHPQLYSEAFLSAAVHWMKESRYWRCIGIHKPFFTEDTLRVHCWEDYGTQTGTWKMSMANQHALMDLERAYKRQELGLPPNYLWDQWGPIGMIDGSRADALPRFAHNPYVDPDGVDVTLLDVAPFTTHEQIRERYAAFIEPTPEQFDGCFLSLGNGPLTVSDLDPRVLQLFEALTNSQKSKGASSSAQLQHEDPSVVRTLLYLCAEPALLDQLGEISSWEELHQALQDKRLENDLKIDAARMLDNTRHDPVRVRRFYEEKCGFADFMRTNDKTITSAAMAYATDLLQLTTTQEWARPLAQAVNDLTRFQVMGPTAYRVYRVTEDLILDKQRRQWATRFAGEANEEASLDYLLENFGRRPERLKSAGAPGAEFDREQEPIGRQVQRRVLDSDKQNKLSNIRKNRGRVFGGKASVLAGLHQKQMQNVSYGIH